MTWSPVMHYFRPVFGFSFITHPHEFLAQI